MAKEVKGKVGVKSATTNGKDRKVSNGALEDKVDLPGDKVIEFDSDASTSGSEDDDEERDVSKKGLTRLMKALGEDGLSEMDKAHLQLVTGDAEEDEEDEDDESLDEGEEEGSLGSDIEDEEEIDDVDVAKVAKPSVSAKSTAKDSLAASLARSGLIAEEDDDDDEGEEDGGDDEQGIPLESLSEAALAALPESVRATRMYREKINNKDALQRIQQEITLGGNSVKRALPWIETLVVSYNKSIEEELGGQENNATDDDLKRELEFYKQALYTAVQGRQLAKQANLAFTRPSDYFAEMVKSDEHMERVRQKLLDERAGLKASEEAKRQRELKKFGKKVQVEKQLERTKSRKELEEKVKGLKRKRKGGLDGDDDGGGGSKDDFDVQLESAISGKDNKRSREDNSSRGRGGPKMKRSARDDKFGFGGKKRHAKENTRESTNDMGTGVYRSGGRGGVRGGMRGARGGSRGGSKRGASQRPGKARRSGGGRT